MLKGLKYLVFPISFFAGVYFADDVKSLRSNFYYQPQQGFYSRPYDLRIETKNICGKVEVYLTDVKTGEYHKIGPKMFVGSASHRINSVVNLPKEYANKRNVKSLSFLIDLCESILD
ncbi:MAG: hypothetical protein QXR60_02940 [Candidatus Nanoarchaeia archaeon]